MLPNDLRHLLNDVQTLVNPILGGVKWSADHWARTNDVTLPEIVKRIEAVSVTTHALRYNHRFDELHTATQRLLSVQRRQVGPSVDSGNVPDDRARVALGDALAEVVRA